MIANNIKEYIDKAIYLGKYDNNNQSLLQKEIINKRKLFYDTTVSSEEWRNFILILQS